MLTGAKKYSRASLNPDIERGGVISRAIVCRVTTRASLVDVVLDNGCPNHGRGASEETECDLLERAKVDAGTAQSRIELGSGPQLRSEKERSKFTHKQIT